MLAIEVEGEALLPLVRVCVRAGLRQVGGLDRLVEIEIAHGRGRPASRFRGLEIEEPAHRSVEIVPVGLASSLDADVGVRAGHLPSSPRKGCWLGVAQIVQEVHVRDEELALLVDSLRTERERGQAALGVERQVGAEAHGIGKGERTRCADVRALEVVLAEIEADRVRDALVLGLSAHHHTVIYAEAPIVLEITAQPEADARADRRIDAEELVVTSNAQAVGPVGLDVENGADLVALVWIEIVGRAAHLSNDGARAQGPTEANPRGVLIWCDATRIAKHDGITAFRTGDLHQWYAVTKVSGKMIDEFVLLKWRERRDFRRHRPACRHNRR